MWIEYVIDNSTKTHKFHVLQQQNFDMKIWKKNSNKYFFTILNFSVVYILKVRLNT